MTTGHPILIPALGLALGFWAGAAPPGPTSTKPRGIRTTL